MTSQQGRNHMTYEFPQLNAHSRIWQLILHVARYSEGDPTFGKVKLAKILYFADFVSYRDYGAPITGARYIKRQLGPVPNDFFDILDEMQGSGEIFIRDEKAFPGSTYDYQRVLARRTADLVEFSGRDITVVNDIIKDFWNKSAKEISDLSHGIPWEIVQLQEAIPYELSIISDEALTDDEIAHAQGLIKQHGWDV